jgi:hypothetical protein
LCAVKPLLVDRFLLSVHLGFCAPFRLVAFRLNSFACVISYSSFLACSFTWISGPSLALFYRSVPSYGFSSSDFVGYLEPIVSHPRGGSYLPCVRRKNKFALARIAVRMRFRASCMTFVNTGRKSNAPGALFRGHFMLSTVAIAVDSSGVIPLRPSFMRQKP